MSEHHRPANRAQRLQRAGLKVTGPRLAILSMLESSLTHPTAQHVFEALRDEHPSLSLSTVYKTLDAFLRAGLCRRVGMDSTGLRVDGMLFDHDHAVCQCCCRIFDIERSLYPHPTTTPRLPADLKVVSVRVEYEVICPACLERSGTGHPGGGPQPTSNDMNDMEV